MKILISMMILLISMVMGGISFAEVITTTTTNSPVTITNAPPTQVIQTAPAPIQSAPTTTVQMQSAPPTTVQMQSAPSTTVQMQSAPSTTVQMQSMPTTVPTTTTVVPPAETTVITTDKPSQSTTYSTIVSNTVNSDDQDIVTAIYAKFAKDPALIGTTITAVSQIGVVTLSGTVTAQSQADAAAIDAKSVPGVKDVRSTINVTTNPDLNKPGKVPNY